jgi:hypothetical protein
MVELDKTFELLSWAQKALADNVQIPSSSWLNPLWGSLVAIGVGAVLALWGSRVLRTGVVLAFMIVGAAFGKQLAGSLQVDLLVGLVIGAGVAGLVGYLCYRWCVAFTVGLAAMLFVVATFSAPRLLSERQSFEDFRRGVGTGRYDTGGTAEYRLEDFREYFWKQKPEVLYRCVWPAALMGLLGIAVGFVAPRLASIVGTSIVGVTLFCVGAGVLAATRWPAAWSGAQAHGRWLVGAVCCLWLFSLAYQATHPARPVMQVPVPPAPAPSA